MTTPERSWIIGSDPACDLVVEAPAVSGRHCRLRPAGGGYVVEDLDSTNGTFVNGRRLDGPARVSTADRVTLGRVTPMPWPPPTGSIRIVGRDPDCDIVLDEPMVSGRHARIVLDSGAATIEDLGSSNGTSLNSRENRITRAPLSASDVVYLGSFSVPGARLLERRGPPRQRPPAWRSSRR